MNISNGTINGDLTVDTPNATVNNKAIVGGVTNIVNVSNNTFNNEGTLNTVKITDSNGGSFNNTGTINGEIIIVPSSDATAPIILKGNITSEVKVTGNKKPQVKVEGNIKNIKVEAENTDLEITKKAKVEGTEINAKDSILTVSGEAVIINPVTINQPVTVISTKPVEAKIEQGVTVNIKESLKSKGKEVKGKGKDNKVTLQPEKSLYTFNSKLDKTQYKVEDDITISGVLLDGETALDKVDITLKIENKKGEMVSVEQTQTDKDGKFKHTFNVPEELEAGTYILTIKANNPVNQSIEEKLIIVETK
ncbi:MG2 domain-containing protein [Hathewaya massiliensis]|uniref:MG2 domain-containing protein n=1 Tax=Hathewaya massiliensis TaxID=1964382 RepID=UPI0011588FD8|nr:MG2 domain-containing protein [Hathewaya massiliensis]